MWLAVPACWPYIGTPDPLEDVPLGVQPTDTGNPTSGECPQPDEDLGTLMGFGLRSGNTCAAGDDYVKACSEGGAPGPEVAFEWSSPITGRVQIDFDGSDFDTVLTLHSPCPDDVELSCNDDFAGTRSSGTVQDVVEGQTFIVVVEGRGNDCGNYQLNIEEARN